MRTHIFPIHCLLTLDRETGQWVAWCPEMDTYSQGDHPDHAVAMLQEACEIVASDAINDREVRDMDIVRKKVVHPFRYGSRASEDDDWKLFQEMKASPVSMVSEDLDVYRDGLDERVLVHGDLFINMRSGVPRVEVNFRTWGDVPCETYSARYDVLQERSVTIDIRKSTLSRDRVGVTFTKEVLKTVEEQEKWGRGRPNGEIQVFKVDADGKESDRMVIHLSPKREP